MPIFIFSKEPGYDLKTQNLDFCVFFFSIIKQILIANELKLPVIIHSNNTNKIILEIFKTVRPMYGCVFHCFQPNLEDLKILMDYGYYISFAGRITKPTVKLSLEVAKIVPKDCFLVETDSPYLEPVNRTIYINQVVNKLAKVMETTPDEITRITNENTKRLFKL